MGTGHVMRCVAFAELLLARGARSLFVCRDHQGHLIAQLRERSWPVVVLPAPVSAAGNGADSYAAWRGVPMHVDAEQTLRALEGHKPEWMVVDHYGLDAGWEALVRPGVGRLLVIDDLYRPHECDVVLNQNCLPDQPNRYHGLVPSGCQVLLGPRYALLAQEYPLHREIQPSRSGAVRRVLVYFGGVDSGNLTGQALMALCAQEFGQLEVDLVIGTNHPNRDALREQASARPHTRVFGTRPHLADLMATADLAIGAGGVTTWERMCLGVPSVVVSLAENQRPTCEALASAGLIEYLGSHRSVGSAQIHGALSTLLGNRRRLQELSSRGQHLVDGRGASRVAEVMLGRDVDALMQTRNALHEADSRPAGFGQFVFAWIDRCDADRVLALRNQAHVTSQMRTRTAITPTDHSRFLENYNRMDRYDFVLVDSETDRYVGTFYITGVASSPELGKYIGDGAYLGKGIARQATARLLEFCRAVTGLDQLTAVTRADNVRNIALNTALGFKPTGPAQGGYLVMTVEL
jgi:UDP-2,4-diacetamido-2,4,6-trideoxy-beta-L-altropyranose hydrolase